MNYLNFIIIIYLLGMAYWWSTQGLYSSLLHLMAVIIAGALTFAIWEPLTLGLFMPQSPLYAWPIGLLVPFLFFLLVLRLVSDRYLKSNVYFSSIINTVFGGLLGVLAGVLSMGILILGVSFLPVSPSFLGYQPLHVLQDGQIQGQVDQSMWVPVDSWTASFYAMLSSGAFTSGSPMHIYQPQLARQAALYRMTFAVNASPAADPARITIEAMASSPTPLQNVDDSVITLIGDKGRTAGNKLLAIDTKWQFVAGVFDGDSTLRVSSTQIRLVVTHANGKTDLLAPVGASKVVTDSNREYVPFNDDKTYIWSDGNEVSLAFIFLIKQDDRPRYLMVRHARMNLPQTVTTPPDGTIQPDATTQPDSRVRELIGVGPSDETPMATPGSDDGSLTPMPNTGPNTGQSVLDIKVDDKLPQPISKNVVQGFNYDGTAIISGTGTARQVRYTLTKDVMLDHIQTPSQRQTLRILLDRQMARGIFGAARVAAAQVNGIWLVDSNGNKWYPAGFVLLKSNGNQKIHINLGQPLKSAKELPLAELESGDKFYLYFSVAKGIHLISYNVGTQVTPLDMDIPN